MQEKIIELLGRGIPATQVAAAVGCDVSYVSQLLADESVTSQVMSLRATHFSRFAEQDSSLDAAEAAALTKVANLIQYIQRPGEAINAYKVLNAAKRRTSGPLQEAAPAQTLVLDLPEASRVRFTVSADRQVIEIEGHSLTTMPARTLASRLEARNAARLLSTEVPTSLLPALAIPSKRAEHGTGLLNASGYEIDVHELGTSKRTTPLAQQF